MPHLITVVLAQTDAMAKDWSGIAVVIGSFAALITLFGKWITTAFSKQLEQHATQNRERDVLFVAQLDKRDAVQNRNADILQEHTRTLAILILEWSKFDDTGARKRASEFAERTIEKIDSDRKHHP